MPVDVKPGDIVKKLVRYLEEIDTSKGLIILVDMGSLEEIYEDIEKITKGIIGVINNVTTQMAIDVGNCILQGLSVEEIVEKIGSGYKPRYRIIRPIKDKNLC